MATLLAPQDSANMAQAQWQEMAGAQWANGVLTAALNTYTVTVTSGLGISVASGKAIIQGFLARSDAAVALTCAAADPTNPRIDRAVLHADLSAHTLTVQLLTGTPAPSPVPPTLTQTGTVWEISMYQVRVNATQTTLTTGSLTDERTYSSPSGAVNRGGDTMTGALSAPALGVAGGAQFLWFSPAAQYVTTQSGPANWHEFVTWSGSVSKVPWGIGSAAAGTATAYVDDFGDLILGGHVQNVAGQGTAGNFGVPLLVAQIVHTNVTATGTTHLLVYSVTTTGTYRVSVAWAFANGTTPQTISLLCGWIDPDSGSHTAYFTSAEDPARALHNASIGVSPFGTATAPMVLSCSTGNTIDVQYIVGGGTPNDRFTVVIERLA